MLQHSKQKRSLQNHPFRQNCSKCHANSGRTGGWTRFFQSDGAADDDGVAGQQHHLSLGSDLSANPRGAILADGGEQADEQDAWLSQDVLPGNGSRFGGVPGTGV
jgi:hypothetical protein